MDEFRKKQYLDRISILATNYRYILWEILQQLPEDDFDDDYKLTIKLERLKAANQDLVDVIKNL